MSFRFFFIFVATILLVPTSVIANQFYPNGKNNVYTYQSSSGNEITDEVTAVFGNWKQHSNMGGGGQFYVRTTADSNTLRIHTNNTVSILTNFDAPVGTIYSYDIDECNRGTVEIAEKGLSLIVPAGIFNNVIKLDFINESGCADIGILSQWYAENVGIIQWEEITIAGPIQHKLSTATVGSINYPKDIRLQGVSMLGNTDRYVYWTNMMPGIIQGLPTMTFKGELVNNTNSAINLTFGSGQTFDAIIYDNSHTEVIRWSTGKLFTMAAESRTIAPGEKFIFQDKLELKYADNSEPLEEGGYTVEIILMSQKPFWKTTLNIKVNRAY